MRDGKRSILSSHVSLFSFFFRSYAQNSTVLTLFSFSLMRRTFNFINRCTANKYHLFLRS